MFALNSYKLSPEMNIPKGCDDKCVYNIILKYLRKCEIELAGRHIDISILETIGPFVKWREIVNV